MNKSHLSKVCSYHKNFLSLSAKNYIPDCSRLIFQRSNLALANLLNAGTFSKNKLKLLSLAIQKLRNYCYAKCLPELHWS